MTASLTKQIPVIGFAAYSGTGKTTLLKKLIAGFRSRNHRVAVLKHAHHAFDTDIPGKDSYELRHAGASQMVIASDKRLASIQELTSVPTFAECIAKVDLANTDFIFVEGFKNEPLKKIELYRQEVYQRARGKISPRFLSDANVLAVALLHEEKGSLEIPQHIKVLNLNDSDEITGFILQNQQKFLMPL